MAVGWRGSEVPATGGRPGSLESIAVPTCTGRVSSARRSSEKSAMTTGDCTGAAACDLTGVAVKGRTGGTVGRTIASSFGASRLSSSLSTIRCVGESLATPIGSSGAVFGLGLAITFTGRRTVADETVGSPRLTEAIGSRGSEALAIELARAGSSVGAVATLSCSGMTVRQQPANSSAIFVCRRAERRCAAGRQAPKHTIVSVAPSV